MSGVMARWSATSPAGGPAASTASTDWSTAGWRLAARRAFRWRSAGIIIEGGLTSPESPGEAQRSPGASRRRMTPVPARRRSRGLAGNSPLFLFPSESWGPEASSATPKPLTANTTRPCQNTCHGPVHPGHPCRLSGDKLIRHGMGRPDKPGDDRI